MRRKRSTVIRKEQDGLSVKTVLSDVFSLSPREISSLKFTPGGIVLNRRQVRVTEKTAEGDVLEICFPAAEETEVPVSGLKPEILYEDEDILIVNKPGGVPCHQSHGHMADDMGTALRSWCGIDAVRAVGRLDKDVSGIMLYARNRPAAARLSRQREEGILRKKYCAVTAGIFPEEEGILRMKLGRREGTVRRGAAEAGKESVTCYRVMASGENWSVLEVSLQTGRTHQIRAGFAETGHPLFGDSLYGGDCAVISRPALHCGEIFLLQPFENRKITIKAGMPADMEKLIGDLKEGTYPL